MTGQPIAGRKPGDDPRQPGNDLGRTGVRERVEVTPPLGP